MIQRNSKRFPSNKLNVVNILRKGLYNNNSKVTVPNWAKVCGATFASSSLRLESEQQQKGHHQTEQTHGLGQRESQKGVRKQLLFEGRIARVANNQRAKHGPNASP